ncbi:pantoate--beta-alanine ligase [bacterium]|nr:MAG: pantoate--beta-alanine ligase [bacterium]
MLIVRTPGECRRAVAELPAPVGFVPTMGALHAGHLSVIDRAREENAAVAVSIFVNPLQFGPHDDYERYPRVFDRDCALLREHGVRLLYAPSVEVMYPEGFSTTVDVGRLGEELEGARRPSHFRGVATVVAKLLGAVRPHRLYLGQKDAQQTAVLRRLVHDLDIGTEVVVARTARERDGLALSSRNVYLTPEQRAAAPALHRALEAAAHAVARGERDPRVALEAARHELVAPFREDYVAIVDPVTFTVLEELRSPALVLGAAYLGVTRLIDSLAVPGEDGVDPIVTPPLPAVQGSLRTP